MSAETATWLNQNVLVGFTEKRGNAWHYRMSEQGEEPNHYAGAIPIEDVRRRLFFWQAEEAQVFAQTAQGYSEVPNRVAIVRNDTHEVLGLPSNSYAIHQYEEALLEHVEMILDDDLAIGSAGLLKGGAIGWVQVEMPENMEVSGVKFRPHLLATTSLNGSIATTYKRTVTVVVCDNTRAMALSEDGQEYRIRHTANSKMRLSDAREALQVVFTLGEAFAAEIEQLLSLKVTDKQYEKFVAKLYPYDEDSALSVVTKQNANRQDFMKLWTEDERVAPWKNTAFGAVQAVNTYRQHLKPTRGGTLRVERNMMDTITGVTETADRKALAQLTGAVK